MTDIQSLRAYVSSVGGPNLVWFSPFTPHGEEYKGGARASDTAGFAGFCVSTHRLCGHDDPLPPTELTTSLGIARVGVFRYESVVCTHIPARHRRAVG